jgi:callose synthase
VDLLLTGEVSSVVGKILRVAVNKQITVRTNYLFWLLLVWGGSSLGIYVYLVYRAGTFRQFMARFSPYGNYVPLASNPPAQGELTAFKQRTFYYPDTLVYNYVDPDEIPELLKPYAETIFTIAQSIMHRHGFQADNTRNQGEHLVMLLFNETSIADKMVSSPALRIHKRMFHNYNKWCEKLRVRPLLLKEISPVKSHNVLMEDMLLFLLIWGEAANLRHLPECLCFLFHKTMEEHLAKKPASQTTDDGTSSRYSGYFLDMIITPIYEEISKNCLKNVDHCDRKIYDDFNEFFWSPSCLAYELYPSQDNNQKGLEEFRIVRDLPAALRCATKTYLEKRSWLHPLYAMNRVFEWHVITFTILATIAFSNLLQWTLNFTVQVGSFILWEVIFLQMLWTFLELWTLFPSVNVSDSALCGFLFRIVTSYIILCYQTIYFHWSFVTEPDTKLHSLELYNHGDAQFWWWQYIWLSLIALSINLFQCLFCFFPSVGSSILNIKNDVIQAFLSIGYPFSQLYVGKETHVKQREVFIYSIFWITLISFKLLFGYYYVVSTVSVPTLQLYDDYMNYPDTSELKTGLLIFIWWLPHFLVYIIDLYIWYSVWASIAGGIIAIFDRLGAVRDSETFRAHFMRAPKLFYASFMPSVPHTNPANAEEDEGSMKSHLSTMSLSDVVAETSLKHPHTGYYQQDGGTIEEGQNKEAPLDPQAELRNKEWTVFSRIWNEVVHKLREKDYLSDREKELLLFTSFDWLSKPTYLPLYQTAGCVESACISYIEYAELYENEQDKQMKMKHVETYYKAVGFQAFEAVRESWELLTWMMKELLGPMHEDDIDVIVLQLDTWASKQDIFGRISSTSIQHMWDHATIVVKEIKMAAEKRKNKPVVPPDTAVPAPTNLEGADVTPRPGSTSDSNAIKKSLSTGFLSALGDEKDKNFAKLQPFRKTKELVDHSRDRLRDSLKALFNDLKSALKMSLSYSPPSQTIITKINNIMTLEKGFFVHDLNASRLLDKICQNERLITAVRKLYHLLTLRVTQVELNSREANRRLHFLLNSFYMDVPKVPTIRYCKEYSCITPYYSEDILLTKADLTQINSDNVSVLLYLQTLYKHDWVNFLERRGIDESSIYKPEHIMELRMWASCRAQTLFRTVDGMMYTEAAIRLLAELEQLSQPEVDWMCKLKFNYVVACQVYGVFKNNNDSKADDIEFLLARFPNLRVAYIDAYRAAANENPAYYSVLIKASDPNALTPGTETAKKSSKPRIKEVFRIKLPGNPILGEGKPENQNHAIIFTRGRYLQAIDMNQDGYFEEALKMRNLLEEFKDTNDHVIVGFREHIFTGSVSSVANYMALQELSFVTLGQRVLNRPLRIRQHYGHPDMFDKLFVMTEGGMSKASRGINLSEDVFAGFNATIRGHTIHFVEYVQVGKGRDVGLQQTYKFEAKLSQGNAEQSLSRDLSRIGNRLDFFRLLSFYYGGIGHYLSNSLVMFTLVIIVYTMLGLSIYHEEGVNSRPLLPEGLFQMLLAGMGILQTLPLAVTLTVEKGFRSMISEISFMILSGGPIYFIFHIQTKSHYFSQTLLAGGAKYRPTGRGFVTRHSPFEENWRFFAASHIYLGFELIVALVLFGCYTSSKQYAGITWSLWLSAIALVFGPFWFNPLTFEWSRIADDYSSWFKWMQEVGGNTDQSWETWWKDENNFYMKLSNTWKCYLIVQKSTVWIVIAAGIAGKNFFMKTEEQIKFLTVVGIITLFFFIKYILMKFEKDWQYPTRRITSLLLSSSVGIILIYLFCNHIQHFLYMIALYYFMSAVSFILLVNFGTSNHYIMHIYKGHDYLVCHFLFFILAIGSFVQIGYLQTWLLYHNALSRGVEIDDILKYARKSKEKANAENENMTELKLKIAQQEVKIQELMEMRKRSPFSNLPSRNLIPAGDGMNMMSENSPLMNASFTSNENSVNNLTSLSSSAEHSPGGGPPRPLKITNPSAMQQSSGGGGYGSMGTSIIGVASMGALPSNGNSPKPSGNTQNFLSNNITASSSPASARPNKLPPTGRASEGNLKETTSFDSSSAAQPGSQSQTPQQQNEGSGKGDGFKFKTPTQFPARN